MSAIGLGTPLLLPLQEQVSVVRYQSAAPLDAGVAGQLELEGGDYGLEELLAVYQTGLWTGN